MTQDGLRSLVPFGEGEGVPPHPLPELMLRWVGERDCTLVQKCKKHQSTAARACMRALPRTERLWVIHRVYLLPMVRYRARPVCEGADRHAPETALRTCLGAQRAYTHERLAAADLVDRPHCLSGD